MLAHDLSEEFLVPERDRRHLVPVALGMHDLVLDEVAPGPADLAAVVEVGGAQLQEDVLPHESGQIVEVKRLTIHPEQQNEGD